MPNKSKVSKKKKNVFLSPAVLIAMALIVAVVIGLTIAIVQLNNVEEEPNDTSSNTTSGSSGETLKGT